MTEQKDPSATPRVSVISGPTAVGKGTVVNRLKELHPEVFVSISVTTRAPRAGEVDGVHYHFIDDAGFDRLTAHEGLLEWAVVHGKHRYGTPRGPVEEAVSQGRVVVLEIDLQGARQVRQTYPEAQQIFLEPPSWEELVRRLVGRGTENAEQRERRLVTAKEELARVGEFDHVVINHEIDQTVEDLVGLLGL
ncbi:guanylate kinase [Luteococcus japonicus]|uniref:Guanylate kinase n=2 Tax=Luteococcus japonicus TaxID=33984 RepID=A0A1R4IQV6_9ACTN|nr:MULTISPECIES: guanylate kinase [Luteococcus]MDN5563608.1 guanylate kinase [Luteococcus sp.]ROR53519.1 guanylate kinase [Luteococcus japonicus]SJN22271.1 Guanylate kinase [Luteococcus japonicus LSP_Lj1]